jgi:hypothetical protein
VGTVDGPEPSEPDTAQRSEPGEPPADPEAWTDEQWISWLETTDDPDAPVEHRTDRARRWRTGASGTALGAAMLGLHQAIYGPREDQIVIVVDAGGDPPDSDLPEVHLDREHPERSEVVVRRPASESPSDPADPAGPADPVDHS